MISKPAIMRRVEHKCRILEMRLKLKDQQFKTILFIYRLLYQNLMVTANQKPTIDTHTKKEKKIRHQVLSYWYLLSVLSMILLIKAFKFFWSLTLKFNIFLFKTLAFSIYLFSYLFIYGHTLCEILIPRPGIKPVPPALGAWSLNHWTARKVPSLLQYHWAFGDVWSKKIPPQSILEFNNYLYYKIVQEPQNT